MKKKIAIIIERANIALGGAERSVFELAPALTSLGFEVDILAAKGETDAKNIHILCHCSPGKRVGLFNFGKAIKKHLSENQYTLIHSVLPFDFADIYQPRGGTYAESIIRNAASYENKFIESFKKFTAFANFRRTTLLRAERQICKEPNGSVIAALSRYVAKQFKEHYGLPDERIKVIHNGVRINKKIDTKEADKYRTEILTRLGLKEADNPVFFLFAAHNFRLKGLAAAIKAMEFSAYKNAERRGYLIIAGNGIQGRYVRLAKKLGVHRRILFLGAVCHIQNILSITDAAILPTYYDPSSRFILEAIAAGKPVITTKFNGAVDLFVNNRHGRVVNSPEDITALAEAINYFLDKNNIQKSRDAIIEDNLKEKISINKAAGQLEDLYKSILQRRSQR